MIAFWFPPAFELGRIQERIEALRHGAGGQEGTFQSDSAKQGGLPGAMKQGKVVEGRGFEPPASALRTLRSPN